MKKKQDKPLSLSALRKLVSKRDRKASKVFNKYIRTKWKLTCPLCPICNKNAIQCCFHIVSADRKATKFDERNVIGACFNCNNQENFWSDVSRVCYIKMYGLEQYFAIVEESKRNIPAISNAIREELEVWLRYLDNIILTYTDKYNALPNQSNKV
jgi:5-methylcytosine-specific restriction endonuclease McrA